MEKNIRHLLRILIVEYCALWLIAIILFVLGEFNIIPNGLYAADGGSKIEYYLNIINVVLVIVTVPLSLKLFSLNTRKGLRRMNQDEALASYHLWSGIRLGMLFLCIAFGIVTYFLLMNSTGLLCACVALIASFLCFPSEDKIREYLSSRDEETPEDIKSNDEPHQTTPED